MQQPRYEDSHKKIGKMLIIISEMLKNSIFSFSNKDDTTPYSILKKEDNKVEGLLIK